MNIYAVYKIPAAGSVAELDSFLEGHEPVEQEVTPGCEWFEVAAINHDAWVDTTGPVLVPKTSLSLTADKENITADGVDAATIPNIPTGVSVSLNGADPVEVTDGEVTFKTLDVGDHVLTFSGIKYLPQEVIIGAV